MNKIPLLAAALLTVCPLAASAQGTTPATPPATTAPTVAPAPSVTLRYKFAPGQTRRYKFTMNMNETMLTGQSGAGIPMKVTTDMTMAQTVKSVRDTDGAATIIVQIEAMHMQTNGQETVLPAAQLAQMKKPSTIIMLPNGKTLSAQMPSMSSGGMPGMDFSKGVFNGTAFLPANPVKVGDTWNGTVDSTVAGTQMAFTSTLTDLSQNAAPTLATIAQKQTGTINMAVTQGTPIPMKIAGKITGDGTQVFDTDAGAVQSATGTSNTAMTMTFGKPAAGTAPTGMPSAMKMQMQMTYSMQRLPDTAPVAAPAP